jgi:hypothetical protein
VKVIAMTRRMKVTLFLVSGLTVSAALLGLAAYLTVRRPSRRY